MHPSHPFAAPFAMLSAARLAGLWIAVPVAVLLVAACHEAPDPDVIPDTDADAPEALVAPDGIEPLEGPTLNEALEAGAARLPVLYVSSTGFAHRDGAGELTGVTAELLRAFGRFAADSLGIEVAMDFEEEERWATFYQRVRYSSGGVFGIGNVTITEPRRSELAFSPPYMSNVAILMTHEDVPELDALERIDEAFAGMTGLIYPGTLHEERIERLREDHFPDMPTATVTTNDELVDRVASGEGYFGYIDVYNYWSALEASRPLRQHPVGDDDSEEFGIIMPLDSDWEPLMRAFFERDGGLRNTDWYGELLRTHLGEELAALLQGAGRTES